MEIGPVPQPGRQDKLFQLQTCCWCGVGSNLISIPVNWQGFTEPLHSGWFEWFCIFWSFMHRIVTCHVIKNLVMTGERKRGRERRERWERDWGTEGPREGRRGKTHYHARFACERVSPHKSEGSAFSHLLPSLESHKRHSHSGFLRSSSLGTTTLSASAGHWRWRWAHTGPL